MEEKEEEAEVKERKERSPRRTLIRDVHSSFQKTTRRNGRERKRGKKEEKKRRDVELQTKGEEKRKKRWHTLITIRLSEKPILRLFGGFPSNKEGEFRIRKCLKELNRCENSKETCSSSDKNLLRLVNLVEEKLI